ncbi:MAG: hypothetical protein WC645_00720 [Candidatus Margulisiibacteriota bacterium]
MSISLSTVKDKVNAIIFYGSPLSAFHKANRDILDPKIFHQINCAYTDVSFPLWRMDIDKSSILYISTSCAEDISLVIDLDRSDVNFNTFPGSFKKLDTPVVGNHHDPFFPGRYSMTIIYIDRQIKH